MLSVLIAFVTFNSVGQGAETDRYRPLVEKSLALLGTAATGHTENRECFSCHHQALPVMAFSMAKKHGFRIDEDLLAKQVGHTLKFLEKNRDEFAKGHGTGGQADSAGYAMLTLSVAGHKPDETTDAVVTYLLGKDRDKGYWPVESVRPPTEASSFTTTYLGMHALKKYGSGKKREEIDARIMKV